MITKPLPRGDRATINAAIDYSLRESNWGDVLLKSEQRQALAMILEGKNSVVVLPTGYGKSMIYMLLPLADWYIRRAAGLVTEELYTCVVLAIEPLTSLAADQVKRAESMNL